MVVFSGFSEAGTLVQLPTVPALVLHKPSPILLHPRIPAPNPPPSQEILLHPRTHPLRLTVIVLPNCNLTPNRHRKAAFFIGFDTNFLPKKLSILIIFSYTKIFVWTEIVILPWRIIAILLCQIATFRLQIAILVRQIVSPEGYPHSPEENRNFA